MSIALAFVLAAADPRIELVIGQDAASVDDYLAEPCLPRPGGVTTYVGFYDILQPDKRFGGLGIDAAGRPAGGAEWGAGVLDAWSAGQRPGLRLLAIGLDISEGAHPGGLVAIARGRHDAEIAQLARLIRATPVTVALRIGYEFDGSWNKGYADAPAYKAAWRRIVDRLRAAGVTNAQFVWQGSASPIDDAVEGGRRERIADWYPGDRYVDWVGLSWFLPPDDLAPLAAAMGDAPPAAGVLADELAVFARARGKRLMVAESTPQGFDLSKRTRRAVSPLWDGPAGQLRARLSSDQLWRLWYAPFFDFLHRHADLLAAVAYIDAHWDAQPMWAPPYASGYWGDSRIGADPEIARRWRAAWASDPFHLRETNSPCETPP